MSEKVSMPIASVCSNRSGWRQSWLLAAFFMGFLFLYTACPANHASNKDASVSPDGWPPSGQWEPIIGIPDPPFGIETSHEMYAEPGHTYDYGEGPEPYRIGPQGPYTHYVDPDHLDATDTDNPYGTHTRPRKTVPPLDSLPAGSVVQINGNTFEGPGALNGSGTAEAPIFIRGAAGDEPVVTGGFRFFGDYYVIEHLEFDLEDFARNTLTIGKYQQGAPSHIAIRFNHFHGGQVVPTSSYQVIRIVHHWNTTETVSDIVVFGNYFHHIGHGRGEAHYDAVAVSVDANAERVWIVDNLFHHIGGDAVQIACDTPELGDTYVVSNHIYVGRNRSHDNYENFVDLKLCEDIIVSQNEVSNITPLNPSRTPIRYGPGEQADPSLVRRNIWTLYNSIHNVSPHDGAFLLYATEDPPYPTEHYFIGNVVYDVHNAEGRAPAFGAWNVQTMVFLNNVTHRCDLGFNLAGDRFGADPAEQLFFQNNIVGAPHPETTRTYSFSFYGVPDSLDRAVVDHNLYFADASGAPIRWGVVTDPDGLQYTSYSVEDFPIAVLGKGMGSLSADPQHRDPANADFRLREGSPAIDSGAIHPYFQRFEDRYGLSIAMDADHKPIPADGTGDGSSVPDMGAYEWTL